jgi:hypothetical protein
VKSRSAEIRHSPLELQAWCGQCCRKAFEYANRRHDRHVSVNVWAKVPG